MSTLQIAVALQLEPPNSTLTVYLNGTKIGTVLQDAPGEWIATPLHATPPPHPTLESAVRWLVEHTLEATGEAEP